MEKTNLPGAVQKILEDLVRGLEDIYGEGLVSVILYGSAASGEYSGDHSNVNVAVFLKDARLENIAKSSGLIRKFRVITPAFFTEEFIRDSADVFPVEFLDMKENHLVLHGRDVLKDLAIDIKNLRFQCEQELKSKIINMKRAYIGTGAASGLRRLLFKFFVSSLHILRNIVRLKGRAPSYRKEDILTELAEEFNIDVKNMRAIHDAKNGKKALKDSEVEGLFFAFVDVLEKIAEMVDKS